MKSNESFSTQASESVVLPENIKEELHQTINSLKVLLKDNPEFFHKLIDKCLMVGKPLEKRIYSNDVDNMIREEYPDLLMYEDGCILLKTAGYFIRQLCFEEQQIEKIINDTPYNKWGEVRDELDHIVLDYCDISSEEINLIGGIHQYYE